MNNQLFEFENFLSNNHVYHLNEGGAFNPGMLLQFNKATNDFSDKLIWSHECCHARLCVSLYGRIIFLLNIISLDAMSYWAKYEKESLFYQYWNFHLIFDKVISNLIYNWTNTQEGVAVHNDWFTLSRDNSDEAKLYKDKLENIIFGKKENFYKSGFLIFDSLVKHSTKNLASSISHHIGNINYLSNIINIINSSYFLADDLPDSIFKTVDNFIKNKNLSEYEKIEKNIAAILILRDMGYELYIDDELHAPDLHSFFKKAVSAIAGTDLIPDNYRKRLLQFVNICDSIKPKDIEKNGLVSSRFFFKAEKLSGEFGDIIKIDNTEESGGFCYKEYNTLIEKELSYFINTKQFIYNYLPNNIDTFVKSVKNFDFENNYFYIFKITFPRADY